MRADTSAHQQFAELDLPVQDLGSLSFCRSNRASRVKTWVEDLPATRIHHTSAQLYKALPELARLQTDPLTRIEMLEHLRPYVQQCIQGLSQEFLKQPLILPQAALKTATVAQALQKHMSSAYLVAARDLSQRVAGGENAKGKAAKALALAVHRAITGLGLQLLRSYQLYLPAPRQLWLALHSLFRLAEACHLPQAQVRDPLLIETKASTVKQAYLRVLLLAAAQPNQLSQNEVNALYAGLEAWTELASLTDSVSKTEDYRFLVDLCADQAPAQKAHRGTHLEGDIRECNTQALYEALTDPGSLTEAQRLERVGAVAALNSSLSAHLALAWGAVRNRSNERRPAHGSLDVSIGLSAVHYFLAGQLSFRDFLAAATDKRDAAPEAWMTDFNAPDAATKAAEEPPIYSVEMTDASPGGYCLRWGGDIPVQVRAGELLGLRVRGRQWNIAVIRWIRHAGDNTQLGVQVLAADAKPSAAAMVMSDGGTTEYLRALLLPAQRAGDQPPSLLTPSVPFQEYCKVKLKERGEARNTQLNRRLFTTGVLCQFAYRELEAAKASDGPAAAESFNSTWDET